MDTSGCPGPALPRESRAEAPSGAKAFVTESLRVLSSRVACDTRAKRPAPTAADTSFGWERRFEVWVDLVPASRVELRFDSRGGHLAEPHQAGLRARAESGSREAQKPSASELEGRRADVPADAPSGADVGSKAWKNEGASDAAGRKRGTFGFVVEGPAGSRLLDRSRLRVAEVERSITTRPEQTCTPFGELAEAQAKRCPSHRASKLP